MAQRETPLDAAQIVRSMAEHSVDYLVIGGLAVQAHGHVRTTQDVDLLPSPEPDNLARLADCLDELEARPAGAGARPTSFELSARAFQEQKVVSLDTVAGGVDVHLSPPGSAGYEEMSYGRWCSTSRVSTCPSSVTMTS